MRAKVELQSEAAEKTVRDISTRTDNFRESLGNKSMIRVRRIEPGRRVLLAGSRLAFLWVADP